MDDAISLENRYSAHNYEPLPVVLARGKGAHLWDTSGRRYVDMMSAYSAASHGHGHPRILAALIDAKVVGFSVRTADDETVADAAGKILEALSLSGL